LNDDILIFSPLTKLSLFLAWQMEGSGEEICPRQVSISRRRGHEVTYIACFCRQATYGVFVSPASLQYGVFILYLAGVPKIQIACGRDSRRRGGVTKTGGIPDFIWATAGTICRGSYNFEIFGNNHPECAIK